MRTLKLILRNVIIYSIVFTMFFGSAINEDTVSLMKDVVAQAANATYDGVLDTSGASTAAGGILSPAMGYPAIRVSAVNDECTKLMALTGVQFFYEHWGSRIPITTDEENITTGSYYIFNNGEMFAGVGATRETIHSYKYNGNGLIDQGTIADGEVQSQYIMKNMVSVTDFGTSGVQYDAIKDLSSKQLLNGDYWTAIANANVGRAISAWHEITAATGQGGSAGSDSSGIGGKYNAIFNPNKLPLYTEGDFTSPENKEHWYRTLDALMSLYAIAPAGAKADWATAVKNHLNGEPIAIMCEVCPVMSFEPGSKTGAKYGVITAMDYMSYITGTTQSNLIYGANWFNNNKSFIGDIYGAITSSVNNSIKEDPRKDRYPATGFYENNAWSWGKGALANKAIKVTNNGQGYATWVGTKANTAYIETLGITNNAGGIWKAGYTLFGTTGVKDPFNENPPGDNPPTPSGGGGGGGGDEVTTTMGVLAATPDNYHVTGSTFGTNVTLSLYGGLSESDLGAWILYLTAAENKGGNFTIQVKWSRDSGRETDSSGIGKRVDPNGDPYGLQNNVHISASEDAAAATVVTNPTTVVMSAAEMREWITGRRPIIAYDMISDYTPMHTNTKIEYTANITVTTFDGINIKGKTSDMASFLMHEERIGYASTAQAYSEFKNYGVTSNKNGYLKEDFEAMAGVPSTEQMYFAAGGSEFIVDIGLNEAANEKAYRTYDYYYTSTQCEYYSGDQSNETWTVPAYSGILGSSENTINVHGGDLVITCNISGSIGNDATAVTALHSATCPAKPNPGDVADRQSAYDSMMAWVESACAVTINHTSASDQINRTTTIGAVATVSTSIDWGVPADTSDSKACQAKPASGEPGKPGYVAAIPCANEMATANPSGAYGWSGQATITIPCHVICGPCCEHIIPETHDTWTQTIQYDSMEINNIHVWRIDQGAIEKMEEILDLRYVSADVLADHPTIFYNIAQRNEDMKTYKKPVYSDGTYSGKGKYSHQAKVGRMVYSVERDQCDNVVVCLGSRSNQCDGLALTCSHNVKTTQGTGHAQFWAEGFIYTTSNEGYANSKTGNPKHGQTDYLVNPRNTLNGATETYGANLSKNWVTEHTNVGGNVDSKDWSTPEYQGFRDKRDQQNTATMVTDFLILQTTSGVQSVMYYDQSQSTYVDAEMPNIDAANHPYNHDDGGAKGNEVNGVDATAVPGGQIAQRYWFSNPNSASQWDPYEINIGSYTGMYWKGNEGNTGGSTKFDGTGRSNAKATKFDDGPHGSMVMARPATPSKLMMYTGELNIKLNLQNQQYVTGYSEVFFSNQLHWAYDDWMRLNPEKDGLHRPYITKEGTSDYANFARIDTGAFIFDGENDGSGALYYFDTNKRAPSYKGPSGNSIGETTKADHQFSIEEYRLAAGYTQKAVYTDSTVGGNDATKCNDIVIHDPVSTEDTALVSLPQYRDQRTGDIVGGASDVTDKINEANVCPEDPGLCNYRVLNCHYLEDTVIFKTNFTPDKDGNFVNSITGNSLELQPGFTLDKNNKFSGYALRAYGTRISIPFTEMGLTYNTSTRIRVEADIIINPTGKGQMIFSFNKYDVYLPASTERGINENKHLTINTGNGWELKADIPIADGKKHHLAVDFGFNNADSCDVYIDGKKAKLVRFNASSELSPNLIGDQLNIGSWGANDNYGANFWIDDFKVTRLAGTMRHDKQCYSIEMRHSGGNNKHNHTADCLEDVSNTVAPGMVTKTIDGKLWGRIFFHNTAGGFFRDENEALNTNTKYKYSVLDYIQDLKPQGDNKYTFRLEYGSTVSNIWRQTNRPQDEYIANGDGSAFVTGYEAISIPHTQNYWGGLALSTAPNTFIDGSTNHSNWWYAIGSYTSHATATTIPGPNSTNVTEVSLWMLLDDAYKTVDTSNSVTFNYTGNVQTYTVPVSGNYRIEAWGAQAGMYTSGYEGGKGGYTAGTTYLKAGTKLYIYVGQQGVSYSANHSTGAGFNGGGQGYGGGGDGGGASDIRLVGGAWNNTASLQSRILVAGGGGGSDLNSEGGYGGGLVGQSSKYPQGSSNLAYGGSQTSGGTNASSGSAKGSFGSGGGNGSFDGGGGGGGWYGGACGVNGHDAGGGGSSYVNGYAGCDTTYYNPDYTFTNVALTQGGNWGNGKVTITRMGSTLGNVMYWLSDPTANQAALKEYLGDAYQYVVGGNSMTELHTYSNWSKSNNGFYHLTEGVKVNINKDGSFTISTINGWECASAVDIDGTALRNIVITFKGSAKPNTSTGIQFVFSDGTTSSYYTGTYSTNENGDTVCTVTLDNALQGTSIKAIKYDIGSGTPTTSTATVKSIQINGYGTTSKETKVYTVSKSNTPGRYTYETNAFGNAQFDVELIGARGGDGRIGNETTIAKNSGGQGANVIGQTSFGGNARLLFTVGGKGGDQESVDQVGGLTDWTQVKSVTTATSFSFTMKAGKLYRVEMYGASGGSGSGYGHTTGSAGGYGGYSTGVLQFDTDTVVYGYTGGQGVYGGTSATFNGGGAGGNASSGSGGGATHLALANGTLASLNNNRSAVLMVAGGGGGADNAGDSPGGGDDGSGGNGGGTTAQGAWVGGGYNSGYGATQTSGYAFGQGQNGSGTDTGGGGGGYFGGKASQHNNGGAGGGSGYINPTYVKSVESITAQTVQSNRVGCGVMYIYEAEYESVDSVIYDITSTGVHELKLSAGKYLIEAYGAGGGRSLMNGSTGGVRSKGGYSKGYLELDSATTLYACVGGKGTDGKYQANAAGGYNGGGAGSWDGNDDDASGGGGGATSITTTNRGVLANYNSYRSEVLMVAGGGGGTSWNYTPGNGGGTNGGASAYGQVATQSAGYAFGQGQNGSGSADNDGVGGGGGGYFGGYTANVAARSSGGGGSGYVSTTLTDTSTLTGGGNTGNGSVRVTKIGDASAARTDALGGFNGGGNGGIEPGEKVPESAAGGGGATDLRIMSDDATIETYYGNQLTNNSGTEEVSGRTLTINQTTNYNVYKGGNKARTAGDRYIVTWIGTGLNNANIVIDGGIYTLDTSITSFQKGRGIIIESVSKTANRITATYLITETSKVTEFRLQTNGAPISITSKTVQLDNSSYILVAGGGGGAGSSIDNKAAYGGNASTLTTKATAPNTYVEAGTPDGGYAILAGQDGANGNRTGNLGAIGGAGGGYYGGRIVKENTSNTGAQGGAGGGTYADSQFKKTSSVLKDSPDGSGNGYYKLDEYRETVIIRNTNYNEDSLQVLMQYYTLIPDKLSDGSDNPLWSNCNKAGNYHECTKACKEIKVLTCTEPHHQGLHYDVTNEICWEACMNDANHKKSTDRVNVSKGYSFEIGNFINLDYGFTIFFPNRGNFDDGEPYALGGLTSAKGLGFRNIYEVDEDYSDLPYGRGTDMSGGYVNTYVGMNTSKWTRVKRIKLPVNVIYDPTRDGKYAQLYLAGEWITLGDRGTYGGKLGGAGNTAGQGKYDEKQWSNYGSWKYDGIYKEFYNFYCVLNNPEIKAGAYTVEVTAVNASDFGSSGNGQRNDNPNDMTNRLRTTAFTAKHGGSNTQYFDVVGRIGNMIMEDVEDFRFSNLFKQTLTSEEQKQIKQTTYTTTSGLGIKDTLNTDNPSASVSNGYVMTNSGNAFAVVKGVKVEQKYYKVTFEGKGLNVGRFEAFNVDTKQPIEDIRIDVIQESSTKASYYLDLSKVTDASKLDLKFIAKGSNVMAVKSCTFAELGSSPETWLLDGIVREVDETKQNIYFTWVADIRGIKVSSKTKYINTWGTLSWANERWKDFPLSPDKNNIEILQDEPMLAGYSALMDIQTMGSYWKNDKTELQIIPKYYALDVNTGLVKKVDIYMEHEGTYVPLNLADNVNKNNASNPFNAEIFDNTINLDWDNTRDRRNVTDEELTKTQKVYEASIRQGDGGNYGGGGDEDADVYRPTDIPSGHINVLGNNQYMILDGNARSFVGGTETYGSLKNLGNRLDPIQWYRSAQRWHFLVGIPSSAVFVLQGQKPNAANIDALQSGPYIIICTLDITAVGEVYALKYEHRYSGSQMATNYDEYYKNIVKDWTDVGTTDGVHMGSITIKSNGVNKTINLDKYAEQLNYEPIIFVYSVNERSTQDVEIVGTH